MPLCKSIQFSADGTYAAHDNNAWKGWSVHRVCVLIPSMHTQRKDVAIVINKAPKIELAQHVRLSIACLAK